MTKPVIVSLDWDWVVGDCGVGGCCGMCKKWADQMIVGGRGSITRLRSYWSERLEELKELPIPNGIPVYVAESHASIGEVFNQYVSPIVADYDHHHDAYNEDETIDCANWICHLVRYGGKYHRQKSDEKFDQKRIDAVFMCRSAPWTPREMDKYFYELVWHLCFHANVKPMFIGHLRKSMRKTYNGQFESL